MVFGYIYKIPFPNGKNYIGLTMRTLEKRKIQHKNAAKKNNNQKYLYNAIRKYNMIDTFELIEIDTAETQEELCKKEIEYIKKYESYYKKKGYNMTYGGEGVTGYEFTQEDREKISEGLKQYFQDNPEAGKLHGERMKQYFQDNPEAGKLHGERMKQYHKDNPEAGKEHGEYLKEYYKNPEAREKMSERLKQYFQDNPEAREKCSKAQKKRFERPEERKKASEGLKQHYQDNPEAREKMSEIKKQHYQDNPEAREKMSERLKQHYQDNPEAREKMSEIKKQYFQYNPEAREKVSEGLKQYFQDNPEAREKISEGLKQYHKNNPEARKKERNCKPFDIFLKKDGTYVASFDYQFEANEYLQKNYNIKGRVKISDVLRGIRKSSHGFIFKYSQ